MPRRRNAMDPVCTQCGGPNDRIPQSYCRECHRLYEVERRQRLVAIPYVMLTFEQRAWLNRKRPGRRHKASREITCGNEAR